MSMVSWVARALEFGCTDAGGLATHHLAFAFAKEREYISRKYRTGQANSLSDCLINPEKQLLNTWPYGKPINFNFISSARLLHVMDFKSGPTVKWNDIAAAPNFEASESTN
jgi:hypothetical protein